MLSWQIDPEPFEPEDELDDPESDQDELEESEQDEAYPYRDSYHSGLPALLQQAREEAAAYRDRLLRGVPEPDDWEAALQDGWPARKPLHEVPLIQTEAGWQVDLASVFAPELADLLQLMGASSRDAWQAFRAYREMAWGFRADWEDGGRYQAMQARERELGLVGPAARQDARWQALYHSVVDVDGHLKRDVWGSPEGRAFSDRHDRAQQSPAGREAHRERDRQARQDPAVRQARSAAARARRSQQTEADRAKDAERKRAARAQAKQAKAESAEILAALEASLDSTDPTKNHK